ncbi:uncharacterized protein [Hetaerina americana]|uniref:uncharacterized protein n=1 Tax=Hetaerina americana TaxID=62018 RepID=UPI003A7F1D71
MDSLISKITEERAERQAQDPEVWGRKPSYVVGESIEVNCTSAPSHPPAHITWLVNGRQVSEKSLRWFPGPSYLHRRQHGHHHHHHYHRRTGMGRGHHYRNQYRVHSEEHVNDEMGDADDFDMGLDREPAVLPAMVLAPSSSTVQLTFYISEESALEGVTEGENEVTSQAYEENTIVNGRIAITCLATIPAFLGSSSKTKEYADHRLTSVDVDVIIPAKISPVKEEPIIEEPVEVLLFSSAARHTISMLPKFMMVLPLLTTFLTPLLPFLPASMFFMNPSKQMQLQVLIPCGMLNHACPCR